MPLHDPHENGTRCHCVDVASFDELVTRPLQAPTNALRWPRTLPGDFAEVAHLLAPQEGLVVVDADDLRRLRTSPQGRVAVDVILDDLQRLDALGHDPVLNCIKDYPRDTRGLPIATDVLSFHVDRAPTPVDTWLCTYHGKSTEALHDDDAVRLIDDDAVRATLRDLHARGVLHDDARRAREQRRRAQGAAADDDDDDDDDDDFAAFLRAHSFDLHYRAKAGATPYALGTGHLWRVAVAWPGSPTTPCIHRAPSTSADDEPRLLLIC
jgi:hypothetical protein